MIWNEVENLLQVIGLEGLDHRLERSRVAKFRVEGVMVNDVVAMRASRTRPKKRRSVDMADAEAPQIRRQPGRVLEPECLAELQPIRCTRHHGSSDQRTDQGPTR